MNNGAFKPTSMWTAVKEKEIAAFEQGVEWGAQHWKSNLHRVAKRAAAERMALITAETRVKVLERVVSQLVASNQVLEKALKESQCVPS